MASSPPFQVEDQTDEDFFDKLISGEDDDNLGATSAANFADGNDSDDANLTVGEDFCAEAEKEEEGKDHLDAGAGPVNAQEGNKSDNDSLGFDNSVVDSNNFIHEEVKSEVEPDPSVSESSGSVNPGVKEVGWNAFHMDSEQNGGHEFGSYSDFFSELGNNASGDFPGKAEDNLKTDYSHHNSIGHEQYQEGGQAYDASIGNGGNDQDLTSSQYWENLYPGWKYDANTGQWYEVESSEGVAQTAYEGTHSDWTGALDGKTEVSYLQQTVQSVSETVMAADANAAQNVANWNQTSQVNNGYPEHMYFDPQYPGWYYDTIDQEWRSLESYNTSLQSSVQSTAPAYGQQIQNGSATTHVYSHGSNMYGEHGQVDNFGSQSIVHNNQHSSWDENCGNYHNANGSDMWQPKTIAKTDAVSSYGVNQHLASSFHSQMSFENHVDQQESSYNSTQESQSHGKASQSHPQANGIIGFHSYVSGESFNQQLNQATVKQSEQMQFSSHFYGSQNSVNVTQQSFQGSQQFPYAPTLGPSSVGRPPHALVTFGFGGKLIVMRDTSSIQNSSYGSQDSVRGSISILNLSEVVTEDANGSSGGVGACGYFCALSRHAFPGPVVGGSVGTKELNKWIDDRIAKYETFDVDPKKGEGLRLLLSLLKIACQHYGKLRSPFGADTTLKESDSPESAVATLFSSAKKNGTHYGAPSHCLLQLPSEGQIRATASEVQNLLVAGRKKEALQYAQEGQLWGPALVLASQLGDQYYVDTVKQMALHQLLPGSPLRTLCLLIAGQPAEVFSGDKSADSMNMSQQPAQFGANCMLDDWEENLAVITANRTKDDELVIVHLGDCLWRERSEITAAHICYLVAEANFESYSDKARLCLIGADHWKFPRTYASPEAIQRTELYEYSKVLGNSQFILPTFQPYKVIYAHMLAEVGKVSDSLKYCQAALKSLKTSRALETETWKQLVLSLEERIKIHQQGGYATNLAPAKLVGKLLNFFDSTAHRVVGGLPPPAPSTSQGNALTGEHYHQPMGPKVSSSQSTMAMSSLMPSASMEPISDWAASGNKMTVHNRSVSEPDFGRSPRQVDSSKEGASSTTQDKTSGSGGASRFARFGFGSQLLQKTVGLVLRPRPDKQAKLGEKNKFYYDEKLKRWVEEGAEPPAEEAALPPPPSSGAFQNGMSDYNLKSSLTTEESPNNLSMNFGNSTSSEAMSGIPPMPTSTNQFSSRGRMGVRARYVDTFNKGGSNQANLFKSPTVSSVKPAVSASAKFFVPAPATSSEQVMEAIAESAQEGTAAENPSMSFTNDSFQSPPPSSVPMKRFPSMDNIERKGPMTNGSGFSAPSRRTASWSGSFNDTHGLNQAGVKTLGETSAMPPTAFMPRPPSGGSFGDELQEVEL